jgi:type I restriction enzyme S subunit
LIWENKKLSEICDVRDGTHDSPSYQSEGVPLVTSKNLVNGKLDFTKVSFISEYDHESISKRSAVSNGDILFAMIGTVGNPVIVDTDTEFSIKNVGLIKVDENSDIYNKFLIFALNSDFVTRQIQRESKGGTQKFISLKVLRNLKIPLPPLLVQKQIAAVLEKADNLRQQSQKMEQALNSLAQSVFFDMFGDSLKNEKKWVSKTVLDVSRKVTDGTHQTPEWSDSGIPFLFISNIRDGEVNFDTKKFITLECFKELTKTTPIEPDDILYTTVGSYGHVALVKSSFPEFCFQRHIAHIKPDPEKILPEFLYYQLQSQGCKHQADNLVRGIAQKTLNLKDLKSIRIIIPPIELQKEYVLKVSVLSRFKHLNKVEGLDLKLFFNSLMQRAFKGELDLKDVA